MIFPDETLGAYVDGELDAQQCAQLEAAMMTDAALRQRIDRLRALRSKLLAGFSGATQEPVPQRLLDAVNRTRPLSGKRSHPGRWNWAELGAIAATIAGATVLGYFLLRSPDADFFTRRQGSLLAQGALAEALSTQLASEQARNAPVRIGISFRAKDGDYCRTFILRSEQAVAGLACRENEGWQVLAREPSEFAPGTAEPAGSSMPATVLAAIENKMAGDPFDAAGEVAARRANWGAR